MQKLDGYTNCLTNIPNVNESTFNQIILNFEKKINETLFTSAMSVYLSRINQSEGIVFKIYRNNKEIPVKIEYDENISVNYLLSEVDELINNLPDEDYIFDNELLHAYSIFNRKNNDEFVPHEKSILNCLFDENSVEFLYNDSIFSHVQMEFFIDNIHDLIRRMGENPEALLKDLNIVSDNEMELLKRFSKTERLDFDKNETIMNYIHNNALKTPDQIAVSDTITEITYAEFDRYINALSGILYNLGVKKGECVGVLLPRIPMYLVSCMGITRNASVFVPLDLTYPKDRIDYIIEASEMNYIISSKTVDFASQFEDKNILYIEDLDLDTDEVSPNNAVASDPAVIYFTSGSTGKPKGVKSSHYTFLLEALYSSKYLTPGSDIACYVNFTFAFSVVLYSAFVKGANCIILNEHLKENVPELIEFLQVTPLDALILPTVLGATILERTEIKTKNMIIAGERLKEATPTILGRKTDLINCYGSSEALVIAYQDVKKASQLDEIPVGFPAGNTWVYIVDKNNMPLPVGVPGEIVISGLKLALGYHNNESQTNESFVENPFSDCWENERMVHSRDQGYFTFNGELVVKGRIDRQIKLRGLRIEPGEIENVVLNYSPSITNVVVELRNDNLVCYYISDGEIDEDELNEFIKSKVTPYMVPSFYMKMDEFPLNLNGKVDVKALPTPEFAIEEIVEPKTDIEIKLFEIISKVLKTDNFGVTTDLIKLGLNSLSSIKIAYEIASAWGVQLTIKELSDAKDIQTLTTLIDAPIESEDVAHEKQEFYPLSQNQLGVYLESIKYPDKLIYNTTSAVDLGANIDVEKLKSSIVNLVNKYTYLKSILFDENGKTYLKRQDDEPVVVDVYESLATDEIKDNFARPFDLFEGPLYRFEIYSTTDKTVLLMDVHHILFDGTSVNLFINELLDEYDDVNDAGEVSSGFDFILDEKELEGSEKYLKAKEFFEDRLADTEDVTSIEPDISGSKELGSLKEVSVQINKEDIFEFSKRNSITPNSLFLSSSLLTLSKFSYTKDMLLTTISNGRINPKYFKTLAMIVRSLPIAMTIDTNQSVLDYINSVNDVFVDTIDNESYPFTKIFEEYNFVPEIYYAYQVGLFDEKVLKNGNKVIVEPLELDYPKFNICIYVEEDLKNINLIIRYNDQLYSHELMKTLVESIDLVLNKFMDSLTQNTSDISLLTPVEEAEIIKKENELELDIKEPLLKDKFESIASKKADEIAVYATDIDLTFEELNSKANAFANSLIDRGLKTNDKIILKLNRTSKLMIALIGALKAGISFIPVDPNYPQERINHIQEDSGCKMIISDNPLAGEFDVDELLDGKNTQNPKVDLKNDDIAFLIYTSGSTGLPKGVMIKQDSITNYIKPTAENSPINAIANDVSRMLSITTASFIAFMRESLATVMNGVPMVLADEETSMNPIKLADLIRKYEIDGMSATPSRLQQYLTIDDFKRVLGDIKVITIGGEKFIESLYPTLVKYTDADIYNSYGPTEVTIASHAKLMKDNIVSEGKPIHNSIDSIVDIDNNPLPNNIIGNIALGGVGVSAGYWNKPELTKEVFYTKNNVPYYNTGDLGYRRDDGELVVVGRADSQIKLRGLRIETGEIENIILKKSDIDVVFVNVQIVNDTEYLCAYYVADSQIDINKLKEDISLELTDYMIPTFFIQLDALPLNPNGKLDRKKLPAPEIDVEEFIKPRNDIEKEIFDMVSDILGIDEFGVNTDLFTIGLTSLTVIQLTSSIYSKLKAQLNVTEVLKYKTIEKIASEIKMEDVESKDTQKLYPLTSNQLGVYFECIRDTESISYNLPKKIVYPKPIDVDKLKSAIIKAIDNHPYLKTRIIMENGEVYQERRDDFKVDDLIEITDEADVNAFVEPFKLDEGPLFRFKIVGNNMLLADFHHIILDGTSLNILFEEIAKIYDGEDYELEELNGFDYALNEIKTEESSLYKEAELYFANKIQDIGEATLIAQDINGNEEEGSIAIEDFFMDTDVIDQYCGKIGISQNNLFLAAFSFTLSKFVYNKELLFATLSNGRFNPNQQKTLAMMVKTLPIILKLNSDLKLGEFFEYINHEWLNVLAYSSYPLTKISNDYDITPEILYGYHGKIIEDIEMDGMTVERQSISLNEVEFKLSLNIVEVDGQYRVLCEYNDNLYSKSYIDLFLESLETILNQFIDGDINELRLSEIALVKEREDIEFDEIELPIIHKRFEKQVEEKPDDIALVASDATLTYRQLDEKANVIANALIDKGVKPKSNVLFMLPRDSNLIASILGILKAGCAFIPIDPEYPQDRINYIYENSQADYIISNKSGENSLDVNELLRETNIENPNVDVDEEDLAYMIYTSGSTGNPKGVMISHKNICNQTSNPKSTYDSLLCITTISFDVAMDDILTSLSNGLKMVFANDAEIKNIHELAKLIDENKPEVADFTPSRLASYLEIDEFCNAISCLKCVFLGGEQFSAKVFEDLRKYSDAVVYNSYGPTETTITSNNKEVVDTNDITVGHPLHNYITDVRDIDGNLLPDGVMGELYIGGVGVGKGYYNLEEKTKEVFLTINDIPYYRSGDYAIARPNGEIEIKGRIDNQIKLRGLRIEIGEIESNITKFPGIKQSVVVIRELNKFDHLCAYYVAEDEIDKDKLKEFLKDRLTYYMVPTVFMQLEEMPQTPNGKTDLKNLPEPVLIREYVAPENDVEAFFAKVFADILELDEVSVTDNFFEIGGTSLLVTKITIMALNRNYNLNYGDVFANQSPRQLAEFVMSDKSFEKKSEMNYDYTKINDLLSKNTIESFNEGECADSLGNVLLTGATGFLGVHVLRELIENESGDIYCFIRSNKALTGEERLKSILFYYFSENYEELFGERLHVLEGDITNFEDFEKIISYDIDTIINCAANVKHFSSGTDIEDINFGGVLNGLKFAKMKHIKYVQVSTDSIAGESIDNYPPIDVNFTEHDLFIGQTIDNQYLNSKFLAERAILEAAVEEDLDVKIMRVGNLMARSSDSEFQINFESNGFINRLKAFVTIGKMPYSMLMVNVEFSPIDTTAKAIVELSKTPKECVVFHAFDHHSVCFGDIVEIIKKLDLNIQPCEEDEYDLALDEALADKSKQSGVSGLITSIGSGKVKKIWVPTENDYTIQILYRLGIKWPFVSEEYIYKFIKYLDDLDFFSN